MDVTRKQPVKEILDNSVTEQDVHMSVREYVESEYDDGFDDPWRGIHLAIADDPFVGVDLQKEPAGFDVDGFQLRDLHKRVPSFHACGFHPYYTRFPVSCKRATGSFSRRFPPRRPGRAPRLLFDKKKSK